MISKCTLLAPLLLCCCYAQNLGQTRPAGFMPGTSPATPNLALDMCQRQTVPKELNVSRSGKHADPVHKWCTVYEGVLPCLGRTLPTANSASDWYLKLIYNQTTALRMSKSLCARFPYVSNLTCVDRDMPAVGKCMQWTTKSAIDHFYGQFLPRQPLTERKKKLASIYACIISVATAGCFHKELKSCSELKRKLLYDFYIMLSGKCRDIAGIPETTSQPPNLTTEKAPIKPHAAGNVPENQLEEKSSQRTAQSKKETGNTGLGSGKSSTGTRTASKAHPDNRNRLSDMDNGSSRNVDVFRLVTLFMISLFWSRLC